VAPSGSNRTCAGKRTPRLRFRGPLTRGQGRTLKLSRKKKNVAWAGIGGTLNVRAILRKRRGEEKNNAAIRGIGGGRGSERKRGLVPSGGFF